MSAVNDVAMAKRALNVLAKQIAEFSYTLRETVKRVMAEEYKEAVKRAKDELKEILDSE